MVRALRQFARNWRRDGSSAAALLFVVAAVTLSAGSFVLTELLLSDRDTLLRFVPANATAYVHAGGRTAAEALLSSSPNMPTDVHPYEVATFEVAGGDAPQRGILLSWRVLVPPSDEERAALEAAGAAPLDHDTPRKSRRFFVGDPSVATSAKVSAAAGSSLADDAIRADALREMGKRHRIQAFAFPRTVLHVEPAVGANDEDHRPSVLNGISPEPQVIGVSLRLNRWAPSSYVAEVVPLSQLYAGRSTTPAPRTDAPSLAGITADRSLAEVRPSFDVITFFPMPSAEQHLNFTKAVTDAEANVRKTFDSPYALWIREGGPLGPQFLFHLPDVSVRDMGNAFWRLYAAHNPEVTELTLPDGDVAKEYLASPERQMTSVISGETLIGDVTTGILVAHDGRHGVIVSSVNNFIADFSGPRTTGDAPPCPEGIAELRLSAATAAATPPLVPFLSQNKATALTVINNGDKGVYVCGYIK